MGCPPHPCEVSRISRRCAHIVVVVPYGGNTICGAWRGCPDHIGMPEGFQDVLRMEDPYVRIEVDVRMPVVQFYGEGLVTAGLERL